MDGRSAAPTMLQAAGTGCIVSIDFGTHGSGFSYKVGASGTRVYRKWPDRPVDNHDAKTKTALLYTKDGKPVCLGDNVTPVWGWTAVARAQEMPAAERESCTLLERFKLALQPPPYSSAAAAGAGRGPPPLPARLNATHVTADFLRGLRRFILAALKQEAGVACVAHEDNLTWCFTVPACWGDRAKADMRTAARRAGFISDINSDRLLIVYEPEAAALAAKVDGTASLVVGDVFVVVDAGGGTTDVTAHRVELRGGGGSDAGDTVLVEAQEREVDGAYCGSTRIDDAFEAYFRDEVGAAAFDAWKAAHAGGFTFTMSKFEAAKRAFTGNEDLGAGFGEDGGTSWRVPVLPQLHARMVQDDLNKLEIDHGGSDSILLTPPDMRRLFDPVVQEVAYLAVKHAALLAANGTPACKVLACGGFMNSPYLQRRLRAALASSGAEGSAVPVFLTKNPETAVMEGGVLYGERPDLVRARCSRYTYGVRIAAPHEDDAPREGRFWHQEEMCYFTDRLFRTYVEKGQLVGCDEVVDHVFQPLYRSGQTKACLEIYLSDEVGPKYVDVAADADDPSQAGTMHWLAELELDLTPQHAAPDGGAASGSAAAAGAPAGLILVQFKFGQAEVVATAEDMDTHQPVSARFSFKHTTRRLPGTVTGEGPRS